MAPHGTGELAGVGYLVPGPQWLGWTVTGLGILLGLAGWLAWPVWYFLAGLHLRQTPAPLGPAIA